MKKELIYNDSKLRERKSQNKRYLCTTIHDLPMENNVNFFLLFTMICFFSPSFSQTENDTFQVPENDTTGIDTSHFGQVIYHQALSLTELEERYLRINQKDQTTPGYRLQVYSGDREGAYKVKSEFLTNFPELQVYVVYEQPYFKTKIGDFRTELEAERAIRDLGEQCQGCFIIKDRVRFFFGDL